MFLSTPGALEASEQFVTNSEHLNQEKQSRSISSWNERCFSAAGSRGYGGLVGYRQDKTEPAKGLPAIEADWQRADRLSCPKVLRKLSYLMTAATDVQRACRTRYNRRMHLLVWAYLRACVLALCELCGGRWVRWERGFPVSRGDVFVF